MKKDRRIKRNSGENGNALFLILIAVALFAALSYAITQSGRGGGTAASQTDLITAGQVTAQPADVRAAVTRMIVTGTSAVGITYTGAATANDVFDQSGLGGGATNVPPPTAALANAADTPAWIYVPATSASSSGIFITGVGSASTTASTANGGDAIAVFNTTNGVSLSVCKAIQRGLGFASPYTPPATATVIVWGTPGAYLYTGNAFTVANAATNGQDFACIRNGSAGVYAYYGVLIDQ
jgi:hypothetical protein